MASKRDDAELSEYDEETIQNQDELDDEVIEGFSEDVDHNLDASDEQQTVDANAVESRRKDDDTFDVWLLRSAFSEKVQGKALGCRNASAFQITATPPWLLSRKSPSGETISSPSLCQICSM